MAKKLLLKVFTFWVLLLTSAVGWGQCPTSVSISADPGKTICAGESIEFTANPTGGSDLTYQWQVNGLNISNATGQTFTRGNLSNGDKISVVVKSSSDGSCVTNSEFVTITVNPIPTVTTTNTATICSGTGPNILLTASTPSSFSWTVGTITGGITGASNGTGSSINQTLTNPSNSAAGTVQYIVTPTANAGSCAGEPYTITVTVNPKPTVTTANTATTCSGTGPDISLTASTPSSFSWTVGTITGGITGASAGSGSTINQTLTNPSNSAAGSVQYIITPTANTGSCAGEAYTITVNVNPKPTVTTTNTATICSGTGPNISLTPSTPSSFSWTIGTITGGITGASNGTGYTINQTLTNSSNSSAGTVQYIVTPTATTGNCQGEPYTITVTVNPKPTVTTANTTTICSGGSPNISLTASTPSSFSWTVGNVTGGITGAGNGNGATINQTLNNPSNSTAGTVQYFVTPTANTGNCAGTPQTITVTVNPKPAITATTTGERCGTGTVILGATASAGTLNWYSVQSGGTSLGTGTSFTTPSISSTTTYYVDATLNGCTTSARTPVVATVKTTPTITSTTPGNVCNSGTVILGATASAGTINWYSSATGGTSLGTGTSYTTPGINNTTTYYVEATLNGCTTGSRTPVVATVTTTPTITSITPGSRCNNGTVTLSATASAGTVTWYSSNTSTSVLATGNSYSPNITGTTTFYVAAVLNGCSSARTAVTATTYNFIPSTGSGQAAKFKPSGPTSICPPATGLKYLIPSDMTDNAEYYVWHLPPGFTITASDRTKEITVDVLGPGVNAGNNDISVTAYTPCGNSGKSSSLTVNVGNFSAVDAGPDISYCIGPPIELTNNLSGSASSVTWQKISGPGVISGGPYGTAPFTFSSTTAGTTVLRATTNTASGSCPASSRTGTDDITITSKNASSAPTTLFASTATICNGSNTTLTQTGGSLGTGASWKWYSNPGFTTLVGTSTAADASLSVSPTANTTYYLRAESTTGSPCTANVAATGSVTVTVNQPSTAPASIVASAATICNGSNTTLTQTGGSLGTGASWKWYSNPGFTTLVGTSTAADASLSVSPTANTTYYLRAESTTGSPCTANVPATGSVPVTVNQPSTAPASIVASTATICSGGNSTLTQTGGSLGTGASWKWYSNPGFTTLVGISTAADASLSVTPTANTTYYLRAESTTGSPCTANVAATGSVTVTVSQPVSINTQPAASQTVCSGFPVSFSVSATGTGITYQWQFNKVDIPGATSATYNIGQAQLSNDGNYKVIVKGAGTCGNVTSEEAVLIVNEDIDITSQPVPAEICENTNTSISVTATGTGLTYQWRKDGIPISDGGTVSGTTTETIVFTGALQNNTGSYDVVISGEGNTCSQIISNPATLNVKADSTISLSSASGTENQTICINTAITPITYAVGGGGTGASITAGALPSGLTGAYNNGIFTISGTPTEAGTFDYTVTTIGNCSNESLSGTISITPSNTITLSSASVTTSQELCVNTALTNITYTTTGATGATFSGLPDGVIGSWDNNSVTISGTPTTAGTSSNYTVTLTGGCSEVTATGTIIVKPDNTIVLSSAAGTDGQSVCVGTPLTNITYTTTGATGADFSGLPAGVDGIWANNTVTISGTPTTAGGPSTYTVTLTGGCTAVTTTGTINVTPINTVSLSSATDTNAQSVCINTAITDITYNTTGATDATVTGLPSGVTGSWANNKVTITGTPTAAGGPTTYTVTLTGGCSVVTATGAITVMPDNTIALSSASGTNAQAVCINTALTDITYTTTGATGATFSGLPAGVTGEWENNTVTISGTPTVAGGPTTYTVTLTGGCSAVTATGTINVEPNNTITLSSATGTDAQSVCINTELTKITYTTTGATGATFSGLPAGITGTWANNTVTISGTPTAAGGPTTYTVTLTGGCSTVTANGTINVDAKTVGGELNFAGLNRATYLVCHDATSGSSRAMELTGHVGNVIKWQKSDDPNNPNSWTDIAHTGTSYSGYSGLTKTTLFRAVLTNGSCGVAYSKFAVISIIPANIKPDPVETSAGEICIDASVNLTSELNYSSNTEIADGGTFNNANPKDWLADGCGNCLNAGNSNSKGNKFALSATNGANYSGVFYAADNKFAIAHSVDYSVMQTPIFSTFGLAEATLEFNHSYKLDSGSSIRIEISTDGGATYNTQNPLLFVPGPATLGPHNNFPEMNIDLDEYVGRANLRIRFIFDSTANQNENAGSSWAIDNVAIPDRPVNVASEWSYTNAQGQTIKVENQQNITVTPDKIGLNTFKITSFLKTDDGTECRSADPNNSETVNVYVFDKYTSTATATVGACGQNEFSLQGTLTAQEQGANLTFPTLDGFSAPSWKVEGPSGWSFKNPAGVNGDPLKNPNSIFVAPNEGTYLITWAIERNVNDGRSASSCPPVVTSATVIVKNCSTLDFDGTDDFVDIGEGYTGDYSIEAWIRPFERTKPDNTKTIPALGTIISTPKREINMSDLAGYVTTDDRWYHIAVDAGGKLYVDGIDVNKTISATGSERAFIGAKWSPPNATNFFSGWIEEVRIWNGNISQDQIQFLMNQRLQNTTNIGVEIPMPAPGLPYASLVGYYQLLTTNILNGGYTPDLATAATNAKLRNMESWQKNTAPLPYTTSEDGTWFDDDGTWTHADVWDPPYSEGIVADANTNEKLITWNIARVSHDVTSGNKDIKLLGLMVKKDPNSSPPVNGILDMLGSNPSGWQTGTGGSGNELFVSHYLLLDGVIDLNGESQLLQPMGSVLEENSSGYLERDQQGTQTSFNYNYWSSPVSKVKQSNNSGYSVGSVLENPLGNITYINDPFAADGTGKNPNDLIISSYWLWTFLPGKAGEYGEWDEIWETGSLKSGEGFTMKGTSGDAAISDSQNYTFRGKPHNGPIPGLEIGPNQNYLVGNPYPSAIDVNEFIEDNPDIFNGAVYFWDHFAGATHYLQEYIGGYATRTKVGGVAAASTDWRIKFESDIDGTKRPGRFIPVGQGFFLNSVSIDDSEVSFPGGNIKFENDQRSFQKESISEFSIFLIQEKKEIKNKNKASIEDKRMKIWLNFHSPIGYHREILVGVDQDASDGFDYGYDAPLIEDKAEDMYWIFNNGRFVIQAVNDFNLNRELRLGVKTKEAGELTISINELRNIPDEMNIYLRDSLLQVTHDLRAEDYVTESEAGIFIDRFQLIFHDRWAVEEPEEPILEEGPIEVIYFTGTREILIRNPELLDISRVYLNNMLGQQVHVYYNIPEDREVSLPVQRFSAGVYVVKVHTEQGIIVKKVILE